MTDSDTQTAKSQPSAEGHVYGYSADGTATMLIEENTLTYGRTQPMDALSLLNDITLPGNPPTKLRPTLDAESGDVVGYVEEWDERAETAADAAHSMSLNRMPDPTAFSMVVGRRGNLPFLPGGCEDQIDAMLKQANAICSDEEQAFLSFEHLLNVPPGTDQPPLNLPERVEPIGPQPMAEMPPGLALDSESIDALIASSSDAASKASNGENTIAAGLQHVRIVDETKSEDKKDDEAEAATEEANIIDTDLTGTVKESDREFTHAKFLSEEKVQQRYEQIRPIMAMQFPFELDSFQKQGVVSMEAGESVFVAAHTSAGKTVVAEYAIALSKIHKTRVIYTSPIKALSNQKFRDFKNTFDDVGLITGDIQLHTDAFCLVMTTEVLRSMLYNGSEVIRELEWVVFDEVHYINDIERGVVYEEVLIMLPAHVNIVMLSATVPNCVEFADWVGRVKQRKICVIQTLRRPIPLEHFVYIGTSAKSREEMFMVMDKTGQLLQGGYAKAVEAKAKNIKLQNPHFYPQASGAQRGARGGGGGGGGGGGMHRGQNKHASYQAHQATLRAQTAAYNAGQPQRSNFSVDRSVYSNLTAFLQKENMMPCVIFVFSRKRCDDNANMMSSVDLTTAKEKHEIIVFFNKCIERLEGTDKILPQVVRMRSFCERGFAIHHSGVLPILKEVVELLFQRGLVKVLFATETFAMGVNMPARTVVFDSTEKYDGTQKRDLNPTEYTQMAGRAGRRGLDATGIVIILAKRELAPITTYAQLLTGTAVRLESRFRVTYAMLLKLLRVEQFRIEDMLQRSYVERSSLRLVTTRKQRIEELRNEIRALPSEACAICAEPCSSELGDDRPSLDALYADLRSYLDKTAAMWPKLVEQTGLLMKTLAKGRILLINYPPLALTGQLGVVLDIKKDEHNRHQLVLFISANEASREEEQAEIKIYAALSDDERRTRNAATLVRAAKRGIFHVENPQHRSYRVIYDFDLRYIVGICKQSLKNVDVPTILKEDYKRTSSSRPRSPDRAVNRLLVELDSLAEQWSLPGAMPPIQLFGVDIKPKEVIMFEHIKELSQLQAKLLNPASYPCRQCLLFENHFAHLLQRAELSDKLDTLTFQTSSDALLLSEEYQNRIIVLRALEYVDRANIIGLKGKVACEISNQEILITEMLLENKFEAKTCAEIAAMLSPLTCQYAYGGSKDTDFGVVFKHPVNELLRDEVASVATRIDQVQRQCGVHTSFVMDELRFGLMDVVYEWASGIPFSDIMALTQAQEGLIVRCIQRLDEVCKDVRNAARIIGDPSLYERMEECSALIKRDIVFAASLYTQE